MFGPEYYTPAGYIGDGEILCTECGEKSPGFGTEAWNQEYKILMQSDGESIGPEGEHCECGREIFPPYCAGCGATEPGYRSSDTDEPSCRVCRAGEIAREILEQEDTPGSVELRWPELSGCGDALADGIAEALEEAEEAEEAATEEAVALAELLAEDGAPEDA